MRKSRLKGLYHLALIIILLAAVNWVLEVLLDMNLLARAIIGSQVTEAMVAAVVGVSAVLVAWINWSD